MTHYFRQPETFRLVPCKKVAGERARKKCRKWNKLVKLRSKYLKEKQVEKAKLVEEQLLEL